VDGREAVEPGLGERVWAAKRPLTPDPSPSEGSGETSAVPVARYLLSRRFQHRGTEDTEKRQKPLRKAGRQEEEIAFSWVPAFLIELSSLRLCGAILWVTVGHVDRE